MIGLFAAEPGKPKLTLPTPKMWRHEISSDNRTDPEERHYSYDLRRPYNQLHLEGLLIECLLSGPRCHLCIALRFTARMTAVGPLRRFIAAQRHFRC